MGWYSVTKTINGKQYLYLQMTYREGGKVRTKNKYLGPASSSGASFAFGSPTNLPISDAVSTHKPTGSLKVDKIHRLKPKSRDIQNRATLKHQLVTEALQNRKDMQRARRNGEDTEPYKFTAKIFRHSYKTAFNKPIKLK